MSIMLAILIGISIICLLVGLIGASEHLSNNIYLPTFESIVIPCVLLVFGIIGLVWCGSSTSVEWNKDQPVILQVQELNEAQVCVYLDEIDNKTIIVNLNDLWNRKLNPDDKIELIKCNSGWYYGIYWFGKYDLRLRENKNVN